MAVKKRVLVIDPLCVESSRRALYRFLAQEFEIHLLVPPSWRESAHVLSCEPEPTSEIIMHISPTLFGYRNHRIIYTDLWRVMREITPDLVYTIGAPENYLTMEILGLASFIRQRPKIVLYASRILDHPASGFPYRAEPTHRLCDWIARHVRVDGCLYRPSQGLHLLSPYAKKLFYIPHHVDCTIFKRGDLHPQNEMVIGYVGRVIEEKGIHVLLDAMRMLPERIRLQIVGGGPYLPSLQQLADQYGINDRVQFLHPVAYGTMPEVLRRIDALVLPSLATPYWKELFGRVLIEAMACEVPVVGTSTGGIPEVIGDAGILVPPASRRHCFGSRRTRNCERHLPDRGERGQRRCLIFR
jgi:glycosyltransferase involved in cell wall biosynthesis